MKRFFIISQVVIITFLLLYCKNNKQGSDNNTVDIATLRGPSAISMIKMINETEKIEGKPIKFQIKNEPMQIRPLLFQEKVEFAVVPTNMAAILYNKNVPYQVAAIPVWGTLYLFGQDSSISTWADLKGKEIHLMAKGMTPDVMFRYLLEKNGLDPQKDVDLNYSFPTHIELANAVASGKAKLGVISEPLVSMVIDKNNEVSPIFSLNKEWKKLTGLEIPQTSLLVHKDFSKDNPEFIENFLELYKKSVQWTNENPAEASKIIVKKKILNNKNVAEQSIPRCNMRLKKAGESRKLISEYLGIFYNMNPDIIGGKVPDENFYYKK
jgi:NitT/TauT family transport system substrate-binding protein